LYLSERAILGAGHDFSPLLFTQSAAGSNSNNNGKISSEGERQAIVKLRKI
jgi:hypothetical protein